MAEITLEELKAVSHLPEKEAADKLGVRIGLLQTSLYSLGIKQWPYRQIASLNNLVKLIEDVYQLGGMADAEKEEHLLTVEINRRKFDHDLSHTLPKDLTNLREVLWKKRHHLIRKRKRKQQDGWEKDLPPGLSKRYSNKDITVPKRSPAGQSRSSTKPAALALAYPKGQQHGNTSTSPTEQRLGLSPCELVLPEGASGSDSAEPADMSLNEISATEMWARAGRSLKLHSNVNVSRQDGSPNSDTMYATLLATGSAHGPSGPYPSLHSLSAVPSSEYDQVTECQPHYVQGVLDTSYSGTRISHPSYTLLAALPPDEYALTGSPQKGNYSLAILKSEQDVTGLSFAASPTAETNLRMDRISSSGLHGRNRRMDLTRTLDVSSLTHEATRQINARSLADLQDQAGLVSFARVSDLPRLPGIPIDLLVSEDDPQLQLSHYSKLALKPTAAPLMLNRHRVQHASELSHDVPETQEHLLDDGSFAVYLQREILKGYRTDPSLAPWLLSGWKKGSDLQGIGRSSHKLSVQELSRNTQSLDSGYTDYSLGQEGTIHSVQPALHPVQRNSRRALEQDLRPRTSAASDPVRRPVAHSLHSNQRARSQASDHLLQQDASELDLHHHTGVDASDIDVQPSRYLPGSAPRQLSRHQVLAAESPRLSGGLHHQYSQLQSASERLQQLEKLYDDSERSHQLEALLLSHHQLPYASRLNLQQRLRPQLNSTYMDAASGLQAQDDWPGSPVPPPQ